MKRDDRPSKLEVVGLFLVCLLGLPVSAAGADRAPTRDPGVRYEPFAIASVWGPPIVTAQLGHFRVRENRSSGSGREIELAFVRIPSTASRPGNPIVWLSGGPGASGIADLETPALQLFLELRALADVLILDQRGTGRSTPRLDCAGSIQLPFDVAVDRVRAVDALETAAAACAEQWRRQGVDVAAYNTRESAEDVEDLRVALGAEKLRLLAASYGTHLALAAIRAHEDRLERAALVGVVGPDHLCSAPGDVELQLGQISRLVREDPSVAKRVPDLLGSIRTVLDGLRRHPRTVELKTRSGGTIPIVIGSYELAWYTRSLLSSQETIAHLPALFAAMEAGDFSEVGAVAARWRTAPAPALSIFAVRCASSASAARTHRIELERATAALGETTHFAEERVCRAVGAAPLPDAFRAPVQSALPLLFVSGTLDGDAPESNAIEVGRGFANGEQLEVAGAAHVLLGFGDAATRSAIVRFFEGRRLRTTHVAIAAVAFDRPGSPAIGSVGSAVARAGAFRAPGLFGGTP
jgi:pimeloyl-ACP methyl ester carboxylesterase